MFKELSVERILQNMYQHEFTKPQLTNETTDLIDPKYVIPSENMRFLRLMKKETAIVNGHYQIPLPLKYVNVNFVNNRKQILWITLQKKFERDPKIRENHKHFT